MYNEVTGATLPISTDAIELMDEHRKLIALYGVEPAQEGDAYSLAQPSPYRFVPSVVSNQTFSMPTGE